MTNSINKTFIDALPILINRYQDETVNKIATTDNRLCRVVDGNINKRQANNSAGVVMYDSTGNLANLLVYPSDTQGNEKRPFLMSSYQGEAIVLGDLAGEKIAVLGIDNALSLYDSMITDRKNPCILTLPDNMESCFNIMLQAFKPSKVYSTHDKPIKDFWGDCILTIAPLSIALQSDSLAVVLADDDTKVINGWGEVLPLSKSSTHDNPYPVHAFGALADVVRQLVLYAQVPPSMAGQSVLGVLSTIGQTKVNAPFYHSHKPSSLFLLTEAPSGGGKTTVQKLAYKAVFEHDKQIYQCFAERMGQWQLDFASAKNKGEFMTDNPTPINPQFLVSDATIEPVIDKFILDERKNLSWVTSEASKFFGGYTMKSDTATNALGSLTEFYDGGVVSRVRSQRGNNKAWQTNAYDCRLTMDMSGQRVILEPVINDEIMTGQGLLPRFLLACEPTLNGYRDWSSDERLSLNPDTDETLQAFWVRCRYLIDDEKNHIQTADPFSDDISHITRDNENRINMPFAKGAMKHLARFQQDIEYKQRQGQPLANHTAFACRMAENATRIATLLAFFDGQHELTHDYLDNAFKLVWYSMNERLNYGEHNSEPNEAEKLLSWLVKHTDQERLNKSLINRNAPYRGKFLNELLDDLENANYVRLETVGRNKWVVLNPKVKS